MNSHRNTDTETEAERKKAKRKYAIIEDKYKEPTDRETILLYMMRTLYDITAERIASIYDGNADHATGKKSYLRKALEGCRALKCNATL